MSAAHRIRQDAESRDHATEVSKTGSDHETRRAEAKPASAGTPPFDWQVLLLRYLPQPAGSTHVIKRLAPR
jgi:hypothetical protein